MLYSRRVTWPARTLAYTGSVAALLPFVLHARSVDTVSAAKHAKRDRTFSQDKYAGDHQ